MPRGTAARERPDIPVFLFTRLRMSPVCGAARVRSRPRLASAVAVLAATAAVAVLVLVTWPGSGGCQLKAAAAGERAHWACAAPPR
jgi:hypothetical protein